LSRLAAIADGALIAIALARHFVAAGGAPAIG
jgi:hypothetical protein